MRKHVIWSNIDINPDDWRDDYKEIAEENEWDEDTDDENNLWSYINETLEQYFGDEQMNLDKEVDGRILVIADLGLWHGRVSGYKILDCTVSSILSMGECDYAEFYDDGYNIRATAHHHDGTNRYEYRIIREDRDIDRLLTAIYNGEQITRKKLNYYTKSLRPAVASVYGW